MNLVKNNMGHGELGGNIHGNMVKILMKPDTSCQWNKVNLMRVPIELDELC